MPAHRQMSHYAKRRAKKKERYDFNTSFLNQNVDLSNYMYLPEGYETVTLLFYFITLPYGIGLLVIYFFIAQGDLSHFLVLDLFTIVPVWSIGYETIAGLLLINIIYSAIDFHAKRKTFLRTQQESSDKMKKRNPSKYDILKNYSQDY